MAQVTIYTRPFCGFCARALGLLGRKGAQVTEIKKAVALGDLSENAEYHMAKQRQVFVNARLGQLKKRMGELAMVNAGPRSASC